MMIFLATLLMLSPRPVCALQPASATDETQINELLRQAKEVDLLVLRDRHLLETTKVPGKKLALQAQIEAKVFNRDVLLKKAIDQARTAWGISTPQGKLEAGPLAGESGVRMIHFWDSDAKALTEETQFERFRKVTPDNNPATQSTVWPDGMITVSRKDFNALDAAKLGQLLYGASLRVWQLYDPATEKKSKFETVLEVRRAQLKAQQFFGSRKDIQGVLEKAIHDAEVEQAKWLRRWRKDYVNLGKVEASGRRFEGFPDYAEIKKHQEAIAFHVENEAELMRQAEDAAEQRLRDAAMERARRANQGLPRAPLNGERPRAPGQVPREPIHGERPSGPAAIPSNPNQPAGRSVLPELRDLARRACSDPAGVPQSHLNENFSYLATGETYDPSAAEGLEGCARELFLELAEQNRIGIRGGGLSADWLTQRARALKPSAGPPPQHPGGGTQNPSGARPRQESGDPCVYWDPRFGGWVRRAPCP